MPEPLVLLFRVTPAKGEVRVTGDARRKPPARFAIIGGGPHGNAANLRINDAESETAFLARVEAEVTRIHGRLPMGRKQ